MGAYGFTVVARISFSLDAGLENIAILERFGTIWFLLANGETRHVPKFWEAGRQGTFAWLD